MAFDLTTKEGKRKQRIAERAWIISERGEGGDELANWLKAEEELGGFDPEIWAARAIYRGMSEIGWGIMSPLTDDFPVKMERGRKNYLCMRIAIELCIQQDITFEENLETVGDLINSLAVRFAATKAQCHPVRL